MVTFERRSHFFTCTGTFEIIWYRRFVWQTCREHNLNDRFRITSDKISIEAKGNTPKEGSPLLARTSAHKYEVEACFELKGENTSAGLVAYYDENYHFGFGFNHKQMLRYRRGQVSRTESKLPQANQCGKMWLRLRNDANVLSAWYSADGKNGISIHGDLRYREYIIIRYMVSCLSAQVFLPVVMGRWK